VSNSDEPDKKPPPQPTVAWDPADVPGKSEEPTAQEPAGTDPGATVMFTPEDIARLEEESAAVEEAARDEDPLLGTLIRDKWKVLARLGAGSFGTVYKVEDVKGGWVEALKILGVDRLSGSDAEETRARFLREAQIMKRLGKDSKHIVGLSTYEEDIEAGLVYFLMEFVEGRSLGDVLAAEGPLPAERVIGLALQVCDALMVAHEGPEPVVHRDLKLENLMLTRDRAGEDMIKVLDFGIAKIAEREADSRLTTVGTLGTPGYAAPEQLRAEAVDGRTDLFAFGVILYALLTGRDPWLGNVAHQPTHQIYELMVATDRAEVRPMDGAGQTIPPEVAGIVMKLLQRDPGQRFQSARELRDTLLRVQAGGSATIAAATPAATPAAATAPRTAPAVGTRAPSASPVPDATEVAAAPRPRPTPRRKRGKGKWAALLLLVAAGGATAWARPWGRTLDVDGLMAAVRSGKVSAVWFNDEGVEGGLQLVPLAAAANALVPFAVAVPEGERADLATTLREEGVAVDTSWEARRLLDLAEAAQSSNRYYGLDGGDVRSYALRLAEVEPESMDAPALLRKVAEHMAWDAEGAIAEGTPDVAADLLERCLDLVPGHPRCREVSETLDEEAAAGA
jgi:serine/threonine-protein kinase